MTTGSVEGARGLPERPRIRPVEAIPFEHEGRRLIALRDPLDMTPQPMGIEAGAAPALALMDGSRTVPEIRVAVALQYGMQTTDRALYQVVRALDDALLLANGKFQLAIRRALDEYRTADHRPMSHAGAVYPRAAADLDAEIARWRERNPPPTYSDGGAERTGREPGGDLVGMVCPHIDYQRGHKTYAELWQLAEPDLADIETVIILGTDHRGGAGRVTPTAQSYATPYGALPTDGEVVQRLSDAIGPTAFEEELHHKSEHSIELAAVWLHHALREAGRADDVSVIPALCGSFYSITTEGAQPDDAPALAATIDVLERLTRERRTLIVAAGDLAHVGPAFGDSIPLDDVTKAKVRSEDAESLSAICDGDAGRFLDISRNESDRRRICGLPPIYIMLRLLGGASGVQMGYDQCPADAANGSIVSIAGALLYR